MDPGLPGVLRGIPEDLDKLEMPLIGRETNNTKEINRALEIINSTKEAMDLLQDNQGPVATDPLRSREHLSPRTLSSAMVLDSRDPLNPSLQDVKPVPLLSTNTTVTLSEFSSLKIDISGPRMYYQRTPRSARELSPRATVNHLQYNSPLAMYSPEAAAEAYKMHTGQDIPIDGDYPTGGRPAYLDSATRRLIAEEEGGMRYRSPTPQQSSSFKRISSAVGTPVN